MGFFEWLLQAAVQTAITVAAVWLIKETLNCVITKRNFYRYLMQLRQREEFQNLGSAMIKNKTGHEVEFSMFDTQGTDMGDGKVSSDYGVSDDMRIGEVIVI